MNTRNERRINDTDERSKQKQPVAVLTRILIFFFFCPENAEHWNAEPKRGRKNSNRPLGDAESWQQCRSRNDRGDGRFTNLEHREAGGI